MLYKWILIGVGASTSGKEIIIASFFILLQDLRLQKLKLQTKNTWQQLLCTRHYKLCKGDKILFGVLFLFFFYLCTYFLLKYS